MTHINLLVRPVWLSRANEAFIAVPHERVRIYEESVDSVKPKLANTGLLLK